MKVLKYLLHKSMQSKRTYWYENVFEVSKMQKIRPNSVLLNDWVKCVSSVPSAGLEYALQNVKFTLECLWKCSGVEGIMLRFQM